MTATTPPRPARSRRTTARVLLGLLATLFLTALGLLVGLALLGPCPRIEPRALLPVVAFGPAVLDFAAGVAVTVFLARVRRGPPS